ncbi:MAG: hypothetical protein AAF438_12385, partial [Pseudomonadota bacterium]
MLRRVGLFLLTNIAILAVLAVVASIFGLRGDTYQGLLILSAVFGFGGAFISLAMSKFIAKRSVGARVIQNPASETEGWLVNTVQQLAMQSGLQTPEVAVYDSPDVNAFATGARRDAALVAVS